ncbi:MAG TPA: SgcJ/EcaC family oxidoreductase [Caulobacteraceae bacterium]|jgi:uncharacterized protein (TIGR02246 family)|nr:SgcJ/EcaC family oxidoreductase [Caulobacteraceae bacterium]
MTEVIVTGDTQTGAAKPFAALLGHMQGAWNKGNAQAFASVFGEQADFIDLMGGHSAGQQAIAKVHAALFAGPYKGSKVEYRIEKQKPLSQTVTVLFLRMKLTMERDGKPVEMHTRPTLVLMKTQQGWRVATYQITRIVDGAGRAVGGKAGAEPSAAIADEAPEKPAKKK